MKKNNKIAYIYGLSSSQNDITRYIGRTTSNLSGRLSQHLYDAKHPQYSLNPDTHKAKWIRKVLDSGYTVKISIIEETTVLLQNEKEQYWISYYGRDKLVNGTDGGNTVNLTKNKEVTVSFERIRACLKSNNEKKLLRIIENIHWTKNGSFSRDDIIDINLKANFLNDYGFELDAGTTVAEYIKVMSGIFKSEISMSVENLKELYEKHRDDVEFAYQERFLHKACFIPKGVRKFNKLIGEIIDAVMYDGFYNG